MEGHEPSEPVQDGIEQFVAARLAHGRPLTVTRWERGWERHDDGDYDEECYDIDDDEEDEGEDEDW